MTKLNLDECHTPDCFYEELIENRLHIELLTDITNGSHFIHLDCWVLKDFGEAILIETVNDRRAFPIHYHFINKKNIVLITIKNDEVTSEA